MARPVGGDHIVDGRGLGAAWKRELPPVRALADHTEGRLRLRHGMYLFREFVATAWGRLRPRRFRQLTQQRLYGGVLIRGDGEADPIGL